MRVVTDLHGGESLQVDGRESFLEPAQQVDIILKRQVRVQPADNMKFGHCFRPAFAGNAEGLFQGHSVSATGVWLASKGAQAATGYADVGGVDVTVHVEVCAPTVQFFAHMVGE